MTTFFSSTKKTARTLAIVAAFGLLFASCSKNKHLCDAYSYKTKAKSVENAVEMADAASSAIKARG